MRSKKTMRYQIVGWSWRRCGAWAGLHHIVSFKVLTRFSLEDSGNTWPLTCSVASQIISHIDKKLVTFYLKMLAGFAMLPHLTPPKLLARRSLLSWPNEYFPKPTSIWNPSWSKTIVFCLSIICWNILVLLPHCVLSIAFIYIYFAFITLWCPGSFCVVAYTMTGRASGFNVVGRARRFLPCINRINQKPEDTWPVVPSSGSAVGFEMAAS